MITMIWKLAADGRTTGEHLPQSVYVILTACLMTNLQISAARRLDLLARIPEPDRPDPAPIPMGARRKTETPIHPSILEASKISYT
jgi:hypothetical protein